MGPREYPQFVWYEPKIYCEHLCDPATGQPPSRREPASGQPTSRGCYLHPGSVVTELSELAAIPKLKPHSWSSNSCRPYQLIQHWCSISCLRDIARHMCSIRRFGNVSICQADLQPNKSVLSRNL